MDSLAAQTGVAGRSTTAGLAQVMSLDEGSGDSGGVTGNVYTNPSVEGTTGSSVTEDVYTGAGWSGSAGRSMATVGSGMVMDSYTWSASNRLKSVTDYAGNLTEYRYDGDGNRIYMGVNVADGTEADAYPDNHVAGERIGWESQYKKAVQEFHCTLDVSKPLPQVLQVTGADATKRKETYVYGAGGEQLSMSYLPANDADNGWEPEPGTSGAAAGAEKTLYPLTDALGSILALTGDSGQVAARYQYDEFGVPQAAEKFDPNWSGPDNLYGYTGLGYDYSSGLTYARARYYQPELGRFISEDTYEGDLTNPLSLNLYRYVENNPLRYVDPTGNQIMDAGGSADEVYYYYDSDNVRKLSETGEIDYSYYLWWRSYNQEAFDALANSGEGISLNQLFAMRYTIMGKAMLDGQANVSDAGAGITLSGIVGGVKV